MDFFVLKALLGAIVLPFLTGPLGSIALWRRLSFLSDSLAHSALSGVAIALSFGVHPFWGVMVMAVLTALFLHSHGQGRRLPNDTILALSAHSFLALGLVLFSLLSIPEGDLHAYLFGDILSISWSDLGFLTLGAVAVLTILKAMWRRLLLTCISPDLAATMGQNPNHVQMAFTLGLSILIALGLKIFGALLLSAMLVIPAAAGRLWSKTPFQMMAAATIIGILAGTGGTTLSFFYDLPTAPAMVLAGSVLYGFSILLGSLTERRTAKSTNNPPPL